jgi:hypothetical protein
MTNTLTTNVSNNGNVSGTIAGATVGSLGGLGTNTITLNSSIGTGPITVGSASSILYSTGTNTNWTVNTASHNPLEPMISMNPNKTTLDVKGKMVLNGIDLEERLKTIEQVLTIPERDVKLEKKHPKLKKLYDEYIHALAKYRTFEAIKGDEDGTT